MMIDKLNKLINTNNHLVCMTRPRRFGKSYVGVLMCAYYSRGCDNRKQFDGLKLSCAPSFEQYLNKLDVIRIDFGEMYSKYYNEHEVLMDVVSREVGKELMSEFPEVGLNDGDTLSVMLTDIYKKTDRKFVVFIDEYDVLIREKVPAAQFDAYLKRPYGWCVP